MPYVAPSADDSYTPEDHYIAHADGFLLSQTVLLPIQAVLPGTALKHLVYLQLPGYLASDHRGLR